MREASKEARRIHASLEPRKNEMTQEQLEHLYSQSPLMQDIVEEVRTVFERLNDATIYIPTFV